NGTGKNGQITRDDIDNFDPSAQAEGSQEASQQPAPAKEEKAAKKSPAPAPTVSNEDLVERVKISPMRRIISESMTTSK
ncbi:hypothetical protein QP304_10225, partial [Aerococcus urinae]|nr:hypothetical protein [Aerococcus urinae]